MKEIIVNDKNMGKIDAIISEVQGRSKERLITSSDIVRYIEKIERKLDIPKKSMGGISIDVDVNAQNFPNAYKWTPMSTHFCAAFKNGKWRVTSITRSSCRRYGKEVIVEHTEDSRDAIMKKYTTMGYEFIF